MAGGVQSLQTQQNSLPQMKLLLHQARGGHCHCRPAPLSANKSKINPSSFKVIFPIFEFCGLWISN